MEKILAIFSVKGKEDVGKFMTYGEYEIAEYAELGSDSYKYPDFSYVKAKVNKDGITSDYSPIGQDWYGRKYTCEDMIVSLILSEIIGAGEYVIEYLDAGLKGCIDLYRLDSIEVEQITIPKKILYGSLLDLYELSLVTDKFIYYNYECVMLMVDKDTRKIVSDNYFAEVGYWRSVEAIRAGEERHLWGELPQDQQ